MADFHVAFHLFCKGIFTADFLFPECCHEFNLLTKDSNNHEEYVAVENNIHHDQEINNPHSDNLGDAFDIISNASIVLGCHKD